MDPAYVHVTLFVYLNTPTNVSDSALLTSMSNVKSKSVSGKSMSASVGGNLLLLRKKSLRSGGRNIPAGNGTMVAFLHTNTSWYAHQAYRIDEDLRRVRLDYESRRHRFRPPPIVASPPIAPPAIPPYPDIIPVRMAKRGQMTIHSTEKVKETHRAAMSWSESEIYLNKDRMKAHESHIEKILGAQSDK